MVGYTAICSSCDKRYVAPYDTKGWLVIERCEQCPPLKTHQGLAVRSTDSGLTSKYQKVQQRKKYGCGVKGKPIF